VFVIVGLVLLFVAEVAVLVEVAHQIGWLAAILLLILVSAAGPWLVRRAGLTTWRRAQERYRAGQIPGRELLDSVLLLAAGVLILVPGFITDTIGVLLLIGPVRALARWGLAHSVGRKLLLWGGVSRAAGKRAGGLVNARSRPTGSGDGHDPEQPPALPPDHPPQSPDNHVPPPSDPQR
jgi:UPF0716 protein FxsA